MNNNKELVNLVTDLVDAVTFDADKVVINGIDCYKTIVPICYIDAVGSALIEFKKYEDYLKGTAVGFTKSQSGSKCYTTTECKTKLPEGVVKAGYFEKSPQGGIQYAPSVSQSNLDIRKLADYLSKSGLCAFEYAEELLDDYFSNPNNFPKSQGTTTTESQFNSAAETRECMHRYAEIRNREMNSILEKLSATVNVMITESSMMGNKGVSITYADHLSQFFPKPKLEYVFTALAKELTSVGYDVEFNLPCQIIHIRW